MSAWTDQIFEAGQVNAGNVVRRSIYSVQKYSSAKELEYEVRERFFHMAVIGNQYVIVCNRNGTIHVVC
jgi:hypothetical protein